MQTGCMFFDHGFLLNAIVSELLSKCLGKVSPAIDDGAHDEIVHDLASRPHAVLLHCLKSSAGPR